MHSNATSKQHPEQERKGEEGTPNNWEHASEGRQSYG